MAIFQVNLGYPVFIEAKEVMTIWRYRNLIIIIITMEVVTTGLLKL